MIRTYNPLPAFFCAFVVLAGISLLVLMTSMPKTFPALHEPVVPRPEHYKTWTRCTQAENAHAIIADPKSPCRLYSCNTGQLRVCTGDLGQGHVTAFQWLWYDEGAGMWREGTAFIQRHQAKADRYIGNNNCMEIVQ